jgi:uncharacterized protein YecE (DUF72 family)
MQSGTPPSAITGVRVGCAGWSLPRDSWPEFPGGGSHLQRYAARFNAVEINSSFYRPHQPATYARWAGSVPADFRFSVKLPKTLTHEKRLHGGEDLLDAFLEQAGCLGEKLGCLLVQLPPSLAFDAASAGGFLAGLRRRHAGGVALEPRHASWFTAPVDGLLKELKIARVLADPVLFDAGRAPGGDPALVYVRLHGSPRMYYSAYAPEVLDALLVRLKSAAASDASVWCVFDNTASGAAVPDALYLARGPARR